MLPAFHREQIAAAHGDDGRGGRARARRLARRRDRRPLRLDARAGAADRDARAVRLRPRRSARDVDRRRTSSSEALGFWGSDYLLQMLRGPGTPSAADRARAGAARRADLRARSTGAARPASAARTSSACCSTRRDEDGAGCPTQDIRDQVMTLLFAGHDTTTSTVAFLFYELARNPEARARVVDDLAAGVDGRARAGDRRDAAHVPARVDRAAPRDRAVRVRTACRCPAGVPVNYCSWASHRLPDVFARAGALPPERFAPRQRAALPKGAYVPFGGGSRTCIGMRFGQRRSARSPRRSCERFTLELVAGLRVDDPPDADDRPEARPAGHAAGTRPGRAGRPRCRLRQG